MTYPDHKTRQQILKAMLMLRRQDPGKNEHGKMRQSKWANVIRPPDLTSWSYNFHLRYRGQAHQLQLV
jgi:hypothetical protein